MQITAEIVRDFREYYPEFASKTDWTDGYLTRFLAEAHEETGRRWGPYGPYRLKQRGMFAYAAHKAVIARVVTRTVENGGIAPAAAQVTSKTVADESVSYAVAAPESGLAASQNGDLRSTVYGVEFLRLRTRAGMGAVCV